MRLRDVVGIPWDQHDKSGAGSKDWQYSCTINFERKLQDDFNFELSTARLVRSHSMFFEMTTLRQFP